MRQYRRQQIPQQLKQQPRQHTRGCMLSCKKVFSCKKATIVWHYIVLLIVALVILLVLLYTGIWKNIPILAEILYGLQNMF